MDKLRKVLGGEDEGSPSEEVGFASTVSIGSLIKGNSWVDSVSYWKNAFLCLLSSPLFSVRQPKCLLNHAPYG